MLDKRWEQIIRQNVAPGPWRLYLVRILSYACEYPTTLITKETSCNVGNACLACLKGDTIHLSWHFYASCMTLLTQPVQKRNDTQCYLLSQKVLYFCVISRANSGYSFHSRPRKCCWRVHGGNRFLRSCGNLVIASDECNLWIGDEHCVIVRLGLDNNKCIDKRSS